MTPSSSHSSPVTPSPPKSASPHLGKNMRSQRRKVIGKINEAYEQLENCRKMWRDVMRLEMYLQNWGQIILDHFCELGGCEAKTLRKSCDAVARFHDGGMGMFWRSWAWQQWETSKIVGVNIMKI